MSTDFALLELSDKIAEAIDKKKFMIGIFVDLSKAFDTLNHNILLQKLISYGIRGSVNDWFRSNLEEREQFVLLNDVSSNERKITTDAEAARLYIGPVAFFWFT